MSSPSFPIVFPPSAPPTRPMASGRGLISLPSYLPPPHPLGATVGLSLRILTVAPMNPGSQAAKTAEEDALSGHLHRPRSTVAPARQSPPRPARQSLYPTPAAPRKIQGFSVIRAPQGPAPDVGPAPARRPRKKTTSSGLGTAGRREGRGPIKLAPRALVLRVLKFALERGGRASILRRTRSIFHSPLRRRRRKRASLPLN